MKVHNPKLYNMVHLSLNVLLLPKDLTIIFVMYDSYLLKDVHSVLVNFPREYAQESMMLYI